MNRGGGEWLIGFRSPVFRFLLVSLLRLPLPKCEELLDLLCVFREANKHLHCVGGGGV